MEGGTAMDAVGYILSFSSGSLFSTLESLAVIRYKFLYHSCFVLLIPPLLLLLMSLRLQTAQR